MDAVTLFVWFLAFCAIYLIMYNVFLKALLDDEEDDNEN